MEKDGLVLFGVTNSDSSKVKRFKLESTGVDTYQLVMLEEGEGEGYTFTIQLPGVKFQQNHYYLIAGNMTAQNILTHLHIKGDDMIHTFKPNVSVGGKENGGPWWAFLQQPKREMSFINVFAITDNVAAVGPDDLLEETYTIGSTAYCRDGKCATDERCWSHRHACLRSDALDYLDQNRPAELSARRNEHSVVDAYDSDGNARPVAYMSGRSMIKTDQQISVKINYIPEKDDNITLGAPTSCRLTRAPEGASPFNFTIAVASDMPGLADVKVIPDGGGRFFPINLGTATTEYTFHARASKPSGSFKIYISGSKQCVVTVPYGGAKVEVEVEVVSMGLKNAAYSFLIILASFLFM